MQRIYFSFFWLFVITSLRAQVNTESMRRVELGQGWHQLLTVSAGYISGNSNILNLRGLARTDYASNRYYTFLAVNYQRGVEDGDVFINKGFVHLRTMRSFTKKWKAEWFVQKEFNDFILLKSRELTGGGLRLEIVETDTAAAAKNFFRLNAGIGLMGEWEKYDGREPDTRLLRSTNYLSFRWQWNELVTMTGTGYYQFDTRRISDYRILIESVLGVSITKHVAITATANFRYDRQPPDHVRRYDLDIQNGVSVIF